MSLTIDDDRLRRKLEEKELNGQYGMNPVQGPQGPQGTPQNGGVTETGIPVSVVDDAKQTSVWSAAQRAQSSDGSGAASTFNPRIGDNGGTGIQMDGVQNQPTGEITVQPPNTSGQQLLSSSLRGAESNDGSDPQGGATDEQKQQRYQTSQEGNLTSIAYSGNGESTTPTPSGLDARLGVTAPDTGGAGMIGSSDGANEANGTGGAGMINNSDNTGSTDSTNANSSDGTNGTEKTDNTNGPDGTDGNVNGSGNEEDKNDSANGNVDDGNKPVETAEDEAKRLAEQKQQEQLQQQQQQKAEEEKLQRLAA